MKVFRSEAAQWFPGMEVHVVVGTDRCRRATARMGYGEARDSDAWTCHADGEGHCLVCLSDGWLECSPDQRTALAAHEAVHCAQAWMQEIGEGGPGDEEMAYAVQCCLMAILAGVEAEREKGRVPDGQA